MAAVTPTKEVETPTKTINFLTPSSDEICLLCQTKIKSKEVTIRLRKDSVTRQPGKVLELLFGVELDDTFFPCIDRNCWRQVLTHLGNVNSFKEKINKGKIKII